MRKRRGWFILDNIINNTIRCRIQHRKLAFNVNSAVKTLKNHLNMAANLNFNDMKGKQGVDRRRDNSEIKEKRGQTNSVSECE